MSFEIIADLKIENLVTKFAQKILEVNSPFSRIRVLVQSTGMSRYLQIKCAEENEIVANLDFEFPTVFIRKIALEVFQKEQQFFENLATLLIWQIFGKLKNLQEKYPILANYLSDKKEIGRYQLAVKIAQIFNNYLSYRLDWLASWENNNYLNLDEIHEKWQAELWQDIVKNRQTKSEFELLKLALRPNDLKKKLQENKHKLPEQILLFGISALPPLQLEFFKIIAEIIPVKFFYLAPSATFWGDSKRKSGEGNLLLKNWGKHGREFYNILVNQGLLSFEDVEPENSDLTSKNLLQNIQYLIQENESIPQDLYEKSRDESIRISANYSKIREVQSLYHWLLQIMSKNIQIKNKDILVLIPNLQDYITSIRAIFDNPENEKNRLFYSISDTISGEENIIVKAFSKLLNLAESRHISEEVFNFLEQEAVAKKMQLSGEDLLQIRNWIIETKIAWGDDLEFRQNILNCQNYTDEQNTWNFGFERLLSGYIYGENKIIEISAGGKISAHKIEQNKAILLGNFLDICQRIFKFCDDMKVDKTAESWCKSLIQACDSFFKFDDEYFEEKTELKRIINDLKLTCEVAKNTDLLPFNIIKTEIQNALNNKQSGRGFLNGKITFCRLLPMRSIASKVIAILGLNNKDFPLQDTKMAFDLTNISPRECDKSKRNEDQFLFLETFLSAREKFYLSYIGKNNITNKEIVPSIMISEFIEFLEKNNCDLAKIFYQMPLQGFNEKLFTESSEIQSFSQLDFQLAKDLQEKINITDKISKNWQILKENHEVDRKISIHDLENFIRNSAKVFLQKNLNVSYKNVKEKTFLTEEPIGELSSLNSSVFGRKILNYVMINEEKKITSEKIFEIGKLDGILSEFSDKSKCDYLEKVINSFEKLLTEIMPAEALEIDKDKLFSGEFTNLFLLKNNIISLNICLNKFHGKDFLSKYLQEKILDKVAHDKKIKVIFVAPVEHKNKEKETITEIDYLDDLELNLNLNFNFDEFINLYYENLENPLPLFPESIYDYLLLRFERKTKKTRGNDLLIEEYMVEYNKRREIEIREKLVGKWKNDFSKYYDTFSDEMVYYFGKKPLESDETWLTFKNIINRIFTLTDAEF